MAKKKSIPKSNPKEESEVEDNVNAEEEEEEYIVDEGEPDIIPIIRGGKIVQININGGILPLRCDLDYKEFTESLLPLLMDFVKYVDLRHLIKKTKGKSKPRITKPWNKKGFKDFWGDLNEKQEELVKIVYNNEEISRQHLIKDLIKKQILTDDDKLKANFNGLSASVSRMWNSRGYEPIWKIKDNNYTMNPNILDILEDFFKNS